MLRQFFINEGPARRRDHQTLGNFYHDALCNVLQDRNQQETTFVTLKNLKVKILHLHHAPHQRLFLDTDAQDGILDEEPSL
jgi:hypothetical protein